jgi:hypothetical protein
MSSKFAQGQNADLTVDWWGLGSPCGLQRLSSMLRKVPAGRRHLENGLVDLTGPVAEL